jgi:hypothetical protein
MRDLMRPIPKIHLGMSGPPPLALDESILRTMGLDVNRDWSAEDVLAETPAGWPTGSTNEVNRAMEQLARGHMIWDGDLGYRVAAPPADIA